MVALFNCAKKPLPEESISMPDAKPASEPSDSILPLDLELANYILEGKTEDLVRKASTLLTTGSSKDTISAAVYWRDIAMLFMGVEQLDWSGDTTRVDSAIDQKRWEKLPENTSYQMLRKIILELNSCVRSHAEHEGLKSQVARLKQENWVLTQKNFKMEKLLQDLEKVK